MKKIFISTLFLLLALCILTPAFADDDSPDDSGVESLMNSTKLFDNPYAGQKQVSDEEFQKTVDRLKAQKNRKKNKKLQKQGKSFNEDQDSSQIQETADKNLLLCVPAELINGDGSDIPIGHYKIIGSKEGNKTYLEFFQAYTMVAKVPAIETQSDFGETGINFVKLMPYNTERIKVIYGSMDFNAYTFIKLKSKISD